MSYLAFLDAITKFNASRLYAQLMAAFFGILFVVAAAMFALMGWKVAKDPESGAILMDGSWIGSWIFVGSFLLLGYALITLSVLLIALRRYWTCRSDHRPFSLGAYMLMPIFPVGFILSVYALWRLKTDNQQEGEQGGDGDAEEAV